MAVSLKKGENISLNNIKNIIIGLGWDEYHEKCGMIKKIFTKNTQSIDCDSSAFLLKDGKLLSGQDVIFFANLEHESKSILHLGDHHTGRGSGDDEQILVDLDRIPQTFNEIYIAVNIFQCVAREQHFGMIENAFIRVLDGNSKLEICRYNLSDDYCGKTAVIFGVFKRKNKEWQFNALGEGTLDTGIREMVKKFK